MNPDDNIEIPPSPPDQFEDPHFSKFLEREEKKKPSFKKNKTLDKLEILHAPSSHIHRFEKMHSPLNLYNTFSPTHFSPKNISPLKKKISRFGSTTPSLISLKPTNSSEYNKFIEPVPREMTEELKGFLLKSFKKHFIFGFMDEGILENILSSMKCFSLIPLQILLPRDLSSEFLYIIEKGGVKSIEDPDKEIHTYKNGDLLFDDLFFNNHPSNLRFVSIENTILWGMPNSLISLIILQITEKKYNENRAFIDPIHFFSKLTNPQKDSLAYNMNNLKFKQGTVIIEEEQMGMNFYILKEGLLIKKVKEQFLHYLKPGDCFGESVFLQKNRNYTVIVESEAAECLSIKKKCVLDLFEEDFERVIYKNLVRNSIKNSEKFSRLTSMQIDHLINLIKYKNYAKDDKIIPEKTKEKCLIYMLLDGKLDSFNGKIEYGEGFIIGEDYIEDPNQKLPMFFAKEDLVMAELDLYELEKELGGNLKDILEQNTFSHENLILFQKKLDLDSSTLNKKVKAQDIHVLKVLGEGFSGIVLLVEYEEKLFALKIISKGWIIEQELEEYIRNEKEIYMFIDFEFITRLCYTFKDDLSIYFLLEFVNGIDLFTHLCNSKCLSSEEAKFYIAILILCLQYLHNKGFFDFFFHSYILIFNLGIIHRDIKPENIIVDSTGYIKLCDLGIAKLMPSNTSRTYTLLGTKLYIAPEMIIGKGYSFPVDFWSVGICLYEFVCGDVPFGANEEEPYKIYQSIVLDRLKFPSFFKDKSTKDLIKGLLIKAPEKRLGKSFGELKGHPFFMNFPWDDLMNRKIIPEFVPSDKNLTLKNEELEVLQKKKTTLSQLLMNPDVVKVKEMTQKVKSEFVNWDDIF